MSTSDFLCANWSLEQTDCQKEGRFTCKNCFLVIVGSPKTFPLPIYWIYIHIHAYSTVVQHAKSPIGLTISLSASRLWVKKPGSRPGFSKVEHLISLEMASE